MAALLPKITEDQVRLYQPMLIPVSISARALAHGSFDGNQSKADGERRQTRTKILSSAGRGSRHAETQLTFQSTRIFRNVPRCIGRADIVVGNHPLFIVAANEFCEQAAQEHKAGADVTLYDEFPAATSTGIPSAP